MKSRECRHEFPPPPLDGPLRLPARPFRTIFPNEGGVTMTVIRTIRKVWRSRPTIEGAGVHLKWAFGNQEAPRGDAVSITAEKEPDRIRRVPERDLHQAAVIRSPIAGSPVPASAPRLRDAHYPRGSHAGAPAYPSPSGVSNWRTLRFGARFITYTRPSAGWNWKESRSTRRICRAVASSSRT